MASQRIISVDEDPDLGADIVRILSARGHKVTHFSSATELAQAGQRNGPDIVLCRVDICDHLEPLMAQLYPKKTEIQYIQLIDDQSVDEVVDAFWHSNRDCLFLPLVEKMLVLAVERAKERRNHIVKQAGIRRKLEKSMAESERRLSILSADQIAGRQMQQSLLPPSPDLQPPYYSARKVLPSLYLSGDFVNYMRALNDYFVFYLMDVSGHGASSAFVTVMVRQLMHRIVKRQIRDGDRTALDHAPEGFLESINTVLHENEVEKHLTVFCGCLDKMRNRIRYAVAAQLPMPVLITPEGAQFLPGKGRPVGIFPNSYWMINEFQLPDEFILVAFSDGILEILPQETLEEKEAYLLEKMQKLIQKQADIDAVLPCLDIEVPKDLPDDIAIYMLARQENSLDPEL